MRLGDGEIRLVRCTCLAHRHIRRASRGAGGGAGIAWLTLLGFVNKRRVANYGERMLVHLVERGAARQGSPVTLGSGLRTTLRKDRQGVPDTCS